MTRVVLVLVCVAIVVMAMLGMRRGWRNRIGRQAALPPLAIVPHDLGVPVLAGLTGLYVGTTFATSWQDRVLHSGLGERATATATLYGAGVVIERVGAEPIFIPMPSMQGVRLAPGLAGRVVGAGGLLVVRWRIGDALVDTGFRADDKSAYPEWLAVINEKVTVA